MTPPITATSRDMGPVILRRGLQHARAELPQDEEGLLPASCTSAGCDERGVNGCVGPDST